MSHASIYNVTMGGGARVTLLCVPHHQMVYQRWGVTHFQPKQLCLHLTFRDGSPVEADSHGFFFHGVWNENTRNSNFDSVHKVGRTHQGDPTRVGFGRIHQGGGAQQFSWNRYYLHASKKKEENSVVIFFLYIQFIWNYVPREDLKINSALKFFLPIKLILKCTGKCTGVNRVYHQRKGPRGSRSNTWPLPVVAHL